MMSQFYASINLMKPTSFFVIFVLCGWSVCTSCVATKKTALSVSPKRPVITSTGLSYQIITEGTGATALPGQTVRIHETTTLADGTLIFSTRTNNRPLQFLLGGNQVIAGVDEGVTGMRVGERRKLIVPPALSKRSSYPANTPPDATLYYDLELVEIVNK